MAVIYTYLTFSSPVVTPQQLAAHIHYCLLEVIADRYRRDDQLNILTVPLPGSYLLAVGLIRQGSCGGCS